MTNLANINMEISDDAIKAVFEQSLNQAVMAAMGNKEEYIAALINAAFRQKVDEHGKVNEYSRHNKYNWLDIHVKKVIQDAANEAIGEYLEENREMLQEQVKIEMNKKENKSALVNAFVDAAQRAFKYRFNFDAKIELRESDDW